MVATTIKVVPRNRINKELTRKINSPVKYWNNPSDALDEISEIMYHHNFQIKEGSEQHSENNGNYRVTYEIETIYDDQCQEIRNSNLIFMFYRMESGRYEVIAYLS